MACLVVAKCSIKLMSTNRYVPSSNQPGTVIKLIHNGIAAPFSLARTGPTDFQPEIALIRHVTRTPLARLALAGVLLAVLLTLFVAAGAGLALSDPQQPPSAETTTATVDDQNTVAVGANGAATQPQSTQPTPQDEAFMYGVSALAGLLVAGLVLDRWRLDPRRLAVEPRERPLHARFGRDTRPPTTGTDRGDRRG